MIVLFWVRSGVHHPSESSGLNPTTIYKTVTDESKGSFCFDTRIADCNVARCYTGELRPGSGPPAHVCVQNGIHFFFPFARHGAVCVRGGRGAESAMQDARSRPDVLRLCVVPPKTASCTSQPVSGTLYVTQLRPSLSPPAPSLPAPYIHTY